MNTKKTLIQAYTQEDNRIEVASVQLFVCEHEPMNNGEYLKARIGDAFEEYYETEEGAKYVDDNGNNWGDALEIPDSFLRKFGIHALYPLVTGSQLGNGECNWVIERLEFNNIIVVNHDDTLFDIGLADDKIDHEAGKK